MLIVDTANVKDHGHNLALEFLPIGKAKLAQQAFGGRGRGVRARESTD